MSDLSFYVDPVTKKLDVRSAGGLPQSDTTCFHKVMGRLTAVRGKWWADASGTYGR